MGQKEKTLLEIVNQIRRDLQAHLEMQKVIAEIRWHSFNEHKAAGFTEEQALELCKKATL